MTFINQSIVTRASIDLFFINIVGAVVIAIVWRGADF